MSDRATNGVYRKYDADKGKRQPGQNRDCQVRALHMASGMAYDEAWDAVYPLQGKYRTCGFEITFYLDKGELGAIRKLSFPAEKGKTRMTGDEFCRRHRRGNYILHQVHHVVAVEDGIIYDNFDPSKRCVYEAWEINARLELEPERDK